jgi:hypothetical protein
MYALLNAYLYKHIRRPYYKHTIVYHKESWESVGGTIFHKSRPNNSHS